MDRIPEPELMLDEEQTRAYAFADFAYQYAQGEPEILRTDFFNSLLAAYRPTEVRLQLQSAGLGYLNLEVVSDRHFIVWGPIRGDKSAAQ